MYKGLFVWFLSLSTRKYRYFLGTKVEGKQWEEITTYQHHYSVTYVFHLAFDDFHANNFTASKKPHVPFFSLLRFHALLVLYQTELNRNMMLSHTVPRHSNFLYMN